MAVLLMDAGCTTAPEPPATARPVPVVIPQSESFMLQPMAGGEPYLISVGLPASYEEDSLRRYPVLYAVDADAGFASEVEISRFLAFAGEAPELIVVGVGYGADLTTWQRRRSVDLRPEAVDGVTKSGEAGRFLDLFEQELIPLIERRYRAAPDRTLFGYSLGGLFGTYALFHRPGLFQRYILGSPYYGWAQRAALRWPLETANTGPLPSGVVFTSMGTSDSEMMMADWHAFWDAVENAQIQGIEVTKSEIDATHAGGPWQVVVKGLQTVCSVPLKSG